MHAYIGPHLIDKLRYDGFSSLQYAYMAEGVEELEPTFFKDAIGKKN